MDGLKKKTIKNTQTIFKDNITELAGLFCAEQFQYAVARVFVHIENWLQKFNAVLSPQLLLQLFSLILGIKAGSSFVNVLVMITNTLLVFLRIQR